MLLSMNKNQLGTLICDNFVDFLLEVMKNIFIFYYHLPFAKNMEFCVNQNEIPPVKDQPISTTRNCKVYRQTYLGAS